MRIERLGNNVTLVFINKGVFLVSYDSNICFISFDTGRITMGKNFNYSNTTRKHLGMFMERFALYFEPVLEECTGRTLTHKIRFAIKANLIDYDEDL